MSVDRARKDAAEQARKTVRQELAMIRSSRDAGVDQEAVEYERNLADRFAVLVSELEAAQKAVRAGKEALDWLHVEALNGVICTPPSHEGDDDWGDFGGYNVEADTGRNYCASCRSRCCCFFHTHTHKGERMTAIHREPYGTETPQGSTFDKLVREAVDADEQHGDVRGIKYAILAVAQAIRELDDTAQEKFFGTGRSAA